MENMSLKRQEELLKDVTSDHVGYTVPDLDEAITFFTTVLGFEVISRSGPVAFPDDDRITRWFGVQPRDSVINAFIAHKNSIRIELLQWDSADQNTVAPRFHDIGGSHLALTVTDLEAAYGYLAQQPGVQMLEKSERGFFIFFTPWGMPVQVLATPR